MKMKWDFVDHRSWDDLKQNRQEVRSECLFHGFARDRFSAVDDAFNHLRQLEGVRAVSLRFGKDGMAGRDLFTLELEMEDGTVREVEAALPFDFLMEVALEKVRKM